MTKRRGLGWLLVVAALLSPFALWALGVRGVEVMAWPPACKARPPWAGFVSLTFTAGGTTLSS